MKNKSSILATLFCFSVLISLFGSAFDVNALQVDINVSDSYAIRPNFLSQLTSLLTSSTINWSSSDETVATVAPAVTVGLGGLLANVTGHSAGAATITANATSASSWGKVYIPVMINPSGSECVLSPPLTTYVTGLTEPCYVLIKFYESIDEILDATTFNWSSSDETVAQVDSFNSSQGNVTGIAPGSAIITANATSAYFSGVMSIPFVVSTNFVSLFNTIQTTLASAPNYVLNNIDTCGSTPSACSGLFFAKTLADGTALGNLSFSGTLDMTSTNTTTFLQNLGSKLDQGNGRIAFDARTSALFKATGATLYMYNMNLTAIEQSKLVVRYDNGTLINTTSPDYPVSGFSYNPANNGTVYFNTAHFTQFDIDTTPPTMGDTSITGIFIYEYIRYSAETSNISVSVTDDLSGINSSSCEYTLNDGATWFPAAYNGSACVVYNVDTTAPYNYIRMNVRDNAGFINTNQVTHVYLPTTAALNDLTFDRIKSSNNVASNVTTDLNLVTYGKAGTGTTVMWTSNSSAVRATDGRVTRPASGQNKASVLLTATVKKSGYSDKTTTISVIVQAQTMSDADAVSGAVTALTFDTIKSANLGDWTDVTTNLNLVTTGQSGTAISWASSNTAVISTLGSVSRQSADTLVTLTANISKGSASSTKAIPIMVKGTTDPNERDVANAKAALSDSTVLNGNPSVSEIIGDLYLPSSVTGYSDVTIAWTSSNTSIINLSGKVNRSTTEDKIATLTANFTKGSASTTKDYALTVKKSIAPVVPVNNEVKVDAGQTEIVLDNSNANNVSVISVNSSVAQDQQVFVNLDSLRGATGNVTVANDLNLSRGTSVANYTAVIPSSTTVTGSSSWNGLISVPTLKSASDYTAPSSGSVDVVIDVGAGSELNFSKAIKIVIGGKAGKSAGWSRGTGTLTEITTVCNNAASPTNIAPTGTRECYVNSGADLIIWTFHFTEFAAFTPAATTTTTTTTTTGGGGGGGGGGSDFRWQCTEWSACIPAGLQTRTCTNLGASKGTTGKPVESQTCTYVAPTAAGTTVAPQAPQEVKINQTAPAIVPAPSNQGGLGAVTGRIVSQLAKPKTVVGVLVVFVIVGLGLGGYVFFKRRSRIITNI